MGTTPNYLLPYPAQTDPADVALDMQELAERIELAIGNAFDARLDALERQPQCRVVHSAVQGAAAQSGLWSLVTYNTEIVDTDNMWVIGSPGTITIRTAGVYVITGGCQIDGTSGGYRRYAAIRRNGAEVGSAGQGGMTHVDVIGVDDPKLDVTAIYPCAVNDVLGLHVFHDMAANRNIDPGAQFAAVRVSGL